MIETRIPIQLPPGIFRNGTRQDAIGRWYDGNLMRWVEGYPQPVGGWREAQSSTGGALGALTADATARFNSALAWRRNNGDPRLALGNNLTLMVFNGEIIGGNTTNLGLGAGLTTGGATSVMTGGTYGAGAYGDGPYGDGSGALALVEAASWQLDTFGEVLLAMLSSDGRLLQWDGASASLTGVSGAPVDNIGLVVTPERFVVILGADGDARKIEWADQESLTVWTPSSSNQAGGFTIQTRGRLRCGLRTKSQTLIWSDADLWSMNYIGGSLVYGFQQEGDKCGIIGPHAKAATDTQVFWMGRNSFFMYDGFVKKLPCEVHDYVFEDFNELQGAQVWAHTLAEFGEVWWYYCSSSSDTIDRYVAYNYQQNHWHFGRLSRTCGVDADVYSRPVLVGVDRKLYEHETGEDRDGEVPYLESGIVTPDRNRVIRVQRLIPDGNALGDANLSVYTSMFPVEAETLNGPYSMANPTDVRLTGRHFRLRVEEANETSWRVGVPELGVIPQGRR
jgi:hypothetical protein